MTTCIRRPGATWTSCTCPPCRVRKARTANLYRMGRIPPSPSEQAWQVVDHLIVDLDWTWAAVGSVCDVPPRTIAGAIEDRRAGRSHTWSRATARAILARRQWPTAGQIGVAGTSRRLQALTALGWTLADLSERSGLAPMTLSVLRAGVRSRRVNALVAATVRDLYDTLAMTPGTSDTARAAARRDGWVPPLAWDDESIDDPRATPIKVSRRAARALGPVVDHAAVERAVTGDQLDLTKDERVLVVGRLAARGLSDGAIAEQLGVTVRTVHRDRAENGIPSRWVA